MNTKSRIVIAAFWLFAAGVFTPDSNACTRAVYLGPDNMVVTGRTMDWKEDVQTNLFIFPRGIERKGAKTDHTISWTSKYGSVIAAGYDIGTSDGMNEKGLVVNVLFLPETSYYRPNDTRPVMGLSIWAQYVLDNFATVDEAVAELQKETFRIDAPDLPNGSKSTLHFSISDATGNSAILEYIDGNLHIYKGRQYQVMTNSPTYEKQQAINDYWKQIGGLVMLPGTNKAPDRFVRASFYIDALPQTSDPWSAAAGVFSVMRNVSVPLGITIPDQPSISSTRWRTVSDQKDKIYYFESTLSPDILWVDFKDVDFKAGAPIKKLILTNGEVYSGNTADKFKNDKGLDFLFGI
ncbi:linear amide C-N hydrolase [Coprobacter tertius]|uniref:Linear amide C-N hydrolase n=1 Tax=Coprobacter tertius TaxID=2944915 RepID=A0ABT1MJD4_9BACT|nr:linear amide C-N hydrolase [Coprobacter tertius]MCP9612740.1 linear amide C-N hydrolase [Coprobacter tertius]